MTTWHLWQCVMTAFALREFVERSNWRLQESLKTGHPWMRS